MKIVVPIDLETKTVCMTFGRTWHFSIYDTETKQETIVENPASDEQSGAGIKAAQFVVDSGADVLITIRCGENSAEVLKAADIKIYKAQGSDYHQNFEKFQAGELSELTTFHAGFHGVQP